MRSGRGREAGELNRRGEREQKGVRCGMGKIEGMNT